MMTGKKRRVFPSTQPDHGRNQSNEPDSIPNTIRLHPQVDNDRVMRYCSPSTSLSGNDGNSQTGNPSHPYSDSQLPEFGSLLSYNVTPDIQKQLWELEVGRLVHITSRGTPEVLCPDPEIASSYLLHSSVNGGAFEKLRDVADHIAYSLEVCITDDKGLPGVGDRDPTATKRRHTALRRLVGEDVPFYLVDKKRTPVFIPISSPGTHQDQATDQQDKPTKRFSPLDEAMIEQYYHVVDQIAATLAHLAVLGRANDHWQTIVLACLAKITTKLKVLAHELPENIKTSLRNADQLVYQRRDVGVGSVLDDNDSAAQRYITECCSINEWLEDCFMEALTGLGAQRLWWTKSGDFDLGVLIYPAGVRGTRTLLSQDRKGTVSGTSEIIPMSFASNALDLVRTLGALLAPVPRNSETRLDTFESLAHLTFDFEGPSGDTPRYKSQNLPLLTILEFIVISIPLALSSSKVGHGFAQCLQTISTLPAFRRPTNTEPRSNSYGFVRLKSTQSKTDQSIATWNGTVKSDHQHGFKIASTLATSFLTKIRHNPLQRLHPEQHGLHSTKEILLQAQNQRKTLENITKTWMIKEDSIIISCHVYVGLTLSFAAILVVGGLLSGFLVGERVPAVDPFNLTMFSWIVGGFGLLVAKNIRVSDWTWRDFLLRRVTCRTVKEVADVTGMDQQDVLMFLLSEPYSPLKTSGPFQGAFNQPPEHDGFSIDVKPNLQTLLAAGIVPVIVQTLTGPALVCLRLMAGHNGLKTVRGAGKLNDRREIFPDVSAVCIDPPHQDGDRDGVFILESMEWFKVLGVYNFAQAEFR